MKIDVDLNITAAQKRLNARINKAQVLLDLQVMKDSNFYVPKDTGTLESSVVLFSKPGSGLLTWNTEYAKKQYYELNNKSMDRNMNARSMWFEHAKTERIKDWEKIANAEYNK